MTRLLKPLLGLIVLWMGSVHALALSSDDQKAICEIERQWQDAWNRHDMKAAAALFTEDADFVNVNGRFWKGRDVIESNHVETHATMFKDSIWTTVGTSIRFLTPDVALVHVKWGLRGDTNPNGTARPPREGFFTQVFVKRNGGWLITASHNTNILAPQPGSHPSPRVNELPAVSCR